MIPHKPSAIVRKAPAKKAPSGDYGRTVRDMHPTAYWALGGPPRPPWRPSCWALFGFCVGAVTAIILRYTFG
jgi:hypothetical protein